MEEEEIWKDVVGYENLYQVSNLGNVSTLKHKKTFILKPAQNGKGYLKVILRNNNKSKKYFFVHRLVAQAFLPNPNNYPVINHKDENPLNNNVNNLEWCTQKYNCNYGTAQERRAKKISKILTNRKDLSKTVLQYDKNGILINEYPSMKEAERKTGINNGYICSVCKGKLNTAGGYIWKYK